MALLSLLFRQPKKAQIGALQLDASLSETHERSSIVTDHEIEDGSNISDHIRKNPEKLIINGIISNASVSTVGALVGTGISGLQGGVNQLLPGGFGNAAAVAAGVGLGSLAGTITGSPRSPENSFKYIEALWEQRTIFTVITALKQYDSMVIENLSVPRSATIGGSVEFTMAMKKIRIVRSAIVQVPTFQTRNAGSSSNNKLGKQAAKESENSQASILAQALDKGKELIGGLF